MASSGLTKEQKAVIQEVEQLRREAQADPRFAETMRGQGYDQTSWSHGTALVKALKTAGRAREEAKAAQLGATNLYNHQHERTWNRGKTLAQNCMTHFQGQTEWLQTLGLHRRRKDESGASWGIRIDKRSPVEEIVFFLRNLYSVAQTHTEMAGVLAGHGFPADILAVGAAEVEALVAADDTQENAKAEVLRLRLERDNAYVTLKKWLQCARRAATLARKEMQQNGVAVVG